MGTPIIDDFMASVKSNVHAGTETKSAKIRKNHILQNNLHCINERAILLVEVIGSSIFPNFSVGKIQYAIITETERKTNDLEKSHDNTVNIGIMHINENINMFENTRLLRWFCFSL